MIFLGMLAMMMAPLLASHGKLNIDFGIECIFRIFNPGFYRSHPLSELPLRLFEAAASLLFLWVYFATAIKRLHDRDKSGWWMIPFFAIPGLMSQFSDRLPDESYWVMAAGTIVFVLYIWGFIELAFLRGTSYQIDTVPIRWEKPMRGEEATAAVGRAPGGAGISRANSISCLTKLVHPRCDVLSEAHE